MPPWVALAIAAVAAAAHAQAPSPVPASERTDAVRCGLVEACRDAAAPAAPEPALCVGAQGNSTCEALPWNSTLLVHAVDTRAGADNATVWLVNSTCLPAGFSETDAADCSTVGQSDGNGDGNGDGGGDGGGGAEEGDEAEADPRTVFLLLSLLLALTLFVWSMRTGQRMPDVSLMPITMFERPADPPESEPFLGGGGELEPAPLAPLPPMVAPVAVPVGMAPAGEQQQQQQQPQGLPMASVVPGAGDQGGFQHEVPIVPAIQPLQPLPSINPPPPG